MQCHTDAIVRLSLHVEDFSIGLVLLCKHKVQTTSSYHFCEYLLFVLVTGKLISHSYATVVIGLIESIMFWIYQLKCI